MISICTERFGPRARGGQASSSPLVGLNVVQVIIDGLRPDVLDLFVERINQSGSLAYVTKNDISFEHTSTVFSFGSRCPSWLIPTTFCDTPVRTSTT